MKILVTGASRGLGYELVRLGLEREHEMVATWLGQPEDSSDLLKLQAVYGQQLTILQMDVTDEKQVQKAAEQVVELDGVVNSAGVLFGSKYNHEDPIVHLDLEKYRLTLEVNTVGPAIVLKYFAPHLYRSSDPCILNITSEAGHLSPGGYEYMTYSISKHAANMLTQQYRNFLHASPEHNRVRIFMVHPGRMNTVMGVENAQIEPSESAAGIFDLLEKKINPKMEIPFINYKGEPMPY